MPKYLVEADQLYCSSCYNPIHRFNFYWVWCESKERIHELLKAQDESGRVVEPMASMTIASMYRMVIEGQDVPIICLPFKWERTPAQIASIVHEVIHAITFFFRVRDIPLPKDIHSSECDEENFCYFVDWLVAIIIERLDNQDEYKYAFNNEQPYQESEAYDEQPPSETSDQ